MATHGQIIHRSIEMSLIFAAILAGLVNQSPAGEPISASAKKEIESAIQSYESALKDKDAKALAAVLAVDFILTTASGKVLTKKDMLANLAKQDTQYEQFATTGVELRLLGDTAIETGQVRTVGKRSGKLIAEVTRYTDVWVRQKEGWKLLAEHSSFIRE